VPATVRVLKHIQLKYGCPGCDQSIKTASKPAQVLPKSNASPSLRAHIVTAKYVDGVTMTGSEKYSSFMPTRERVGDQETRSNDSPASAFVTNGGVSDSLIEKEPHERLAKP